MNGTNTVLLDKTKQAQVKGDNSVDVTNAILLGLTNSMCREYFDPAFWASTILFYRQIGFVKVFVSSGLMYVCSNC